MLYFKKPLKVEGDFMIWGKDAYNLIELLDNSCKLDIPEHLKVLHEGYNYLKSRLTDTIIEKTVSERLTNLMRQYIVEIKTTYLSEPFLHALSII